MTTLKTWISKQFDTPEKAQIAVSDIAAGGGVVGFILTLLALLTAHI
jgi:hypothetical protein